MFEGLKKHPFAVSAFFESSKVLTFAVPKNQLEHRIPKSLTLDTFQDEWAFVAVAMVQTSALRPKGFPAFLGNDFFLIGYRIFVRYRNNAGKNLRGLYIIKSETNKKKMEFFGNVFTKYSYTTTDISTKNTDKETTIASVRSDFSISINRIVEEAALPENSPFGSWKEARRFAGPLPFTFSFDESKNEMLIVEGVRQNWKPTPIAIKNYHFSFLKNLHLENAGLANAFEINNVPYWWKKGKTEYWQP